MVTTLTVASIEQYLSSLTARGRSENTVRAYSTDLREFLAAMTSPITKKNFDQKATLWLNENRTTWAPKTTGRRMTTLRSFARWVKWPAENLNEYRAPVPGRAMPHPIPEGIAGVIRMIETGKNERQRALVALCGLCGLRVSEALDVTPVCFDVPNRMLTVRGKGDKTRIITVSETAWNFIQPAVIDAVLAGGPEMPIVHYEDRFARQAIQSMAQRAGLARTVSSHDLRATFATAVYDKTKDIRVTQELLGHSSSQTTEGYTGVTNDTMRGAVEVA